MEIPFGEYLPDLPDYKNPGATVAKNVIPGAITYQKFPSAVVYSNALDARCRGAMSYKDSSGNTTNFAGTASKLYKSATGVYADVSKVGGYTSGTDERWEFAKYGERIIATNFSDAIQSFVLGSSSAFANLSATAPQARHITQMRSFVVVGNTFDSVDGNVPHRVRWSALDDPTSWTVSASTQADFQDLDASRGWVQALCGGDYGVIFQERAISRMVYEGSPTIFRFDQVQPGKGTPAPSSVIQIGSLIPYLGIDGFEMFDGSQIIPIGDNKVDRTFWNEVDLSYLHRIFAVPDFDKKLVYWAYPATGNTAGNPNKILCFNITTGRWSFIEQEVEFLYTSLSEGYTLDSLDSTGYNLDTLPFSLDSRVWTGENYLLSGFNTDHKQINFSGTAKDATIETAEMQLFPNYRANVKNTRPMIDGSATVTIQMGARNLLSESASYGAAASVNASGFAPVRSNARYHRVRVNTSGDFNDAQGVEIVDASREGIR